LPRHGRFTARFPTWTEDYAPAGLFGGQFMHSRPDPEILTRNFFHARVFGLARLCVLSVVSLSSQADRDGYQLAVPGGSFFPPTTTYPSMV
ncbi:MAG TPA: hypothetical protein VFN38_17630, partial [Gemmatimonadaceae bacterium]|nr:hypothetical protein [Gemmatimonadaceae bacterium]